MTTDNRTSVFIEEQFPLFARGSGQQLVAFIKKYYESQEQANNYVETIHNLLNYQDIDTAPEKYFDYIAREIIPSIPERLLANRELLAKHIKEIYRVRGGPAGYRILFRALFNEEIDLYNPGDDILRASDGRWVKEISIKIQQTITGNVLDLAGNKIIGQLSGTSAIVDRVEILLFNAITIYEIYLVNVVGAFSLGETVSNIDNSISFYISSAELGPLAEIALTADGGHSHSVGDRVTITGSSGSGSSGEVIQTRADSSVEFYIEDGGSGYSTNTILNITNTSGAGEGAAFIVTEIGAPIVIREIYDDFIYYFAHVVIGDSNTVHTTFVENYANGYAWSTNNTITKVNHGYTNGDRVIFFTDNSSYGISTEGVDRIVQEDGSIIIVEDATSFEQSIGVITSDLGTEFPYYILDASTNNFHVTDTLGSVIETNFFNDGQLQVTKASANLSLSNVNSTIGYSLGTSTLETGNIVSISTINNGYGYYDTASTGTVDFRNISEQGLSDGQGGIIGLNADIRSNWLSGTISKVKIDLQGDNYINQENVILTNVTRLATRNGIAIAKSSAINFLPGRYINTKGWLSWDKYLQDNYYYQEFSYEIRSNQNFASYESTIIDTLHPAGTKMFGAIYLQRDLDLTLGVDEQIAVSNTIYENSTSPSITFVQNSNTQNDRIEIAGAGTPWGIVEANDFVYVTGPTPNTSGTYRISGVLNSNTLLVYNSAVTVIANTALQPISGNTDFTASNTITVSTGDFAAVSIGDDIFITNAANENNDGGPFIVTSKISSAQIKVQTYDGNDPFTYSVNDETAKIEITKQFAIHENTTATANVIIYRHVNTYPYSNNVVL